jgi:hypothetical protein
MRRPPGEQASETQAREKAMNLPTQVRPVMRNTAPSVKQKAGVQPSGGIECTICHIGCDQLPEPARSICHIGCDQVVC